MSSIYVRMRLVVSISQRSEELGLDNLAVLELDNVKPGRQSSIIKCVF